MQRIYHIYGKRAYRMIRAVISLGTPHYDSVAMEAGPLFFLLLLSLVSKGSTSQLCEVCHCEPGLLSCGAKASLEGLPPPPEIQWPVDDDNKSLKVSFDGIFWDQLLRFSGESAITSLTLNNNGINTILPSAFSGLSNLHDLHIINNQLSHLSWNSMKGLNKLKILDLSGNRIVEITEGDLEDLVSIEELILKDNQLTSYPSAFSNLDKLTHLDLSGNQILNVQFDSSMTNLKSLDLSRNKLSTIFKNTFTDAKQLEFLNLSDNDITDIEAGTFNDCSNLYKLTLSHNKLKELPEIPQSVAFLWVQNNQISNWIQLPSKLELLDISLNGIYDISERYFEYLENLNFLNVSGNDISTIGIENSMPQLQVLDLSYNHLETIPEFVTSKILPSLEYLDISGNDIDLIEFNEEIMLRILVAKNLNKVNEVSEENLKFLKGRALNTSISGELENDACIEVYISSCSNLSKIGENTFKHIPLCFLDLSYNNLRELPESAANWESIMNGVNLQGNPWNCVCQMQWSLDRLLKPLYNDHAEFLPELRCETPRGFQGLRLVHWYERGTGVFCKGSFVEQSSNYILSESKDDSFSVAMASNSAIIAMLVAIAVLSIAVIGLIIYLIKGRRQHRQRMRRASAKKRQSAIDARNSQKETNEALTSV